MKTNRSGGISKDGATIGRGALLARAAGTAGTLRRPGHGAGLWAAGAAAFAGAPALAQVSGEQVVHGSASFQRQGAVTTITAGNNAIINYNSFNVRQNETVRFVQPDALSRVLNRINSSLPSRIDGNISSNGKVYIVNPAGVYFGKGAMINVGGIYAAAGTITNQDFLRGVDRFTTAPGARVVNEGMIQAPVIGLIGDQVANFGTLKAPDGAVMMISGDTVLLGERDGHVYAKIETTPKAGPEDPAASSRSAAAAAPKAQGRFGAGDMYALAVWNTGTVKAKDVRLETDHGQAGVSGTIDVSDTSTGGRGGSVEVLGPAVAVAGATIDASGDAAGGRVLLGGNYQGHGPERNAQATVVTPGSTIHADAKTSGDGGTVVVWSDRMTRFDGRITAKGGASGGDGGFVEISSKDTLHSNTNVDLSAPKGDAGTILFDPKFIRIDGGSGDGSDDADASATNLINDAGSNVLGTIAFGDTGTAPNTGNSAGNPFIIRESEIEGTDADIILQATESISASGTFTNSDILLQNNRSLTISHTNSTNDGAIILNGSADGNALEFRTQGSGSISIFADTSGGHFVNINVPKLTTAGGDILVATKDGSVTLSGSVNAGAGTVRLVGTKTANSSGNVSQAAGAVITAGALGVRAGGSIDLGQAANAAALVAAADTGTGTVAYRATGGFTIDTVTADPGAFFALTSGVSGASDVTLTVGAGGTVSQTLAGPVTAQKLVLLGSGTFNLNTATTNDVDLFQAGDNSGPSPVFAASFRDADGVELINNTSVSTDLSLRSDTGQLTASGTSRIGGQFTLEAADIDIDTLAPTFLNPGGAGTATIQPLSAASTVHVGFAGGDLSVAQATLDRLAAFGSLVIGRSDSTVALQFGGTTPFSQNLTLRSGGAGGSVELIAASALSTTLNKNITIQAGTGNAGVFIKDDTATINAGGGSLSITGDVMTLGSTANSIQGTSAVFLQPATPARDIQLGGVDDAAKFSIDAAEFATLQDGFSRIAVGRTDSSGASLISGITATDPLVVQTPSAATLTAMDVSGLTASSGVALFTGGTLNVTQAITALNSEITLRSGADIVLANDLNAGTAAGTGVVRIVSSGAVTENAGVTISGSALGVRAGGAIDLTAGTNDVGTFAASESLAGAAVKYSDTTGVAIGTVGSETINGGATIFTSTSGVTTNQGDFTLVAGGTVSLGADVNVDQSASGGIVRINTTGAVSQPSGRVLANRVGVTSGGAIDLTSATNQIGFVALDASASVAAAGVSVRTANGLTIDSVTADGTLFAGADGLTSKTNASILVNSGTGGTNINQAIDVGTGTIRIASGGTIFQSGAGVLSGGALGVRSGGLVVLQLANTPTTLAADTGTANFLYNLNAGDLAIGSIAAVGGGLFTLTDGIQAGVGGGTVRLVVPGGVSQTQRIVAGALGLRSGTAPVLTDAGNDVGTLAIDVTGGATGVEYRDSNALTIGSVGAQSVFTQTDGVVTAVDATIRSGGLMTINESIDVGGSHDVRLVSGAGITQGTAAGKGIITRALGVNAAGDVRLLNPDNDAATFAGSTSSGVLKYFDNSALTVGSVGADALGGFVLTDGITTAGGDVTIEAGGPIAINQGIAAAPGGTLYLVTPGAITQAAATTINVGALGFTAGGNVDLSQSTNAIPLVAGNSGGLNAFVNVRSGGAVNVGSVAFDPDGNFPFTTGIASSAGAISITAGGALTVSEPIGSGTGGTLLSAGGLVTLSEDLNSVGGAVRITTTGGVTQSLGKILADSLGIRAGADISVFDALNNVSTLAATTGASNGSVGFRDADGFDVGSVGAIPGFTATDGITTSASGTTRLQSGGALTQSGAIVSGALGVRAVGDITLNLTSSGNPVNNVGTFAATSSLAGSPIVYRDVDALTIGSVPGVAGFAVVSGVTTVGADMLLHSGGAMTLANDLDSGVGTVRLVSGGAVTQTSGSVLATNLGVRGAGNIALDQPANNVDVFAAATTSGGVSYVDAGALSIGTVSASGTFTPGVSGVTGTGPITLHSGASGAGDLSFGPGVTVAGTTATLIAGDGPGGAGTTATIDAKTNAPTFSNPGGTAGPNSFTFQQDDTVDTSTSSIPAAAQYPSSVVPPTYRLQSDDGNIIAAAGFFAPNTDLTLAVTPGLGRSVQVSPELVVKSLTIIGASSVQSVTSADRIEFQSDVTFVGNDTFLEGDEINFGGLVHAGSGSGLHTLTLRPKTAGRKINVGAGGTNLDPVAGELDLTALEVSRITAEFDKVIFGEDPLTPALPPLSPFQPLTGTLEIVGPVTFINPTVLGMKGAGSKIVISAPVTMTGTVLHPASLTVTGTGNTTVLAADIITNGQTIDIQDSVLVSDDRLIDTTAAGTVPAGANVTVQGPTDGYALNPNTDTLTVVAGSAGVVTFTNAVGGSSLADADDLLSLAVTGATINIPSVTTTRSQSYFGATRVTGTTTFTTGGTAGDDVSFNGTLDGASAVTANVGAAGRTVFGGNVGGATALTSLAVLGQTVVGSPTLSIRTGTGAASFLGQINGPGNALTVDAGSVTLGGSVGTTGGLGALIINAPTLISTGPLSITTANAPVTFNGTVDSVSSLTGPSAPGLTIAAGSGAISFTGAVGATTPLGSLAATGSTIALRSVRTVGAQNYTGATSTTLAGDLTSIGSGAIAINGPAILNAPTVTVLTAGAAGDAITFTGPVTGTGNALVANAGAATVAFQSDVGSGVAPLASVNATGATITAGNVTTSGAQTYNGNLALSGNLAATGPGSISVTGNTLFSSPATSVTSVGGSVNFLGLTDGATALTVNAGPGSVVFNGAVGSATPLLSLSATGGTITTGSTTTTAGAQTYNGTTRFGGNVTAANGGAGVTVNGPLDLANANVRVQTASGPIALNGTVDGNSNLTLDAGSSTIAVTGAAGAVTPLQSLTATGSSIAVNAVQTGGDQTYNGSTTTSGPVVANNLVVNAPAGLITMGSTVNTSGDQTYNGLTTLSDSVTGRTLRFNDDAVLGNADAESTYTGVQGVHFTQGLWLFGDSVVNAGNGQAYFGGTVETAQTISANPTPTGVAAADNRRLRVVSTRQPGLNFTGNPFLNDSDSFDAWVDAPFLFNANIGGSYTGGPAPTAGDKARMLKFLTFDRGASASSTPGVATIVMTKGQFDPSGDGHFTIPPSFQAENPALDSSTVRILTTGGFDMGGGSKLTAVGNFYAYADSGTVTLSDINALANITIASGDAANSRILINPRASGTIATNEFTSGTGGIGNTQLNDSGVDFVALNNIDFFVVPELTSTGTARFSVPPAPGRSALSINGVDFFGDRTIVGGLQRSDFQNANVDRNLLFPANGNAGADQGKAFTNLTAFGLGLDLRAEGAPNRTNLASALAGALPNAQAGSQVQQTVSLGSNVLDDLLQLGLQVKSMTGEDYLEERTSSLSGRSNYDDVPPLAKPDPDPNRKDYRITINRLSAESVRAVLDAYYDLVGADVAERPERRRQIQNALGASWDKYAVPIEDAGGTPDGVGFRRFVETNESEKQTLQYLDKIGVLLHQIDRLALSPVELRQPKQKTLGDLKAELMSPEQLEAAALDEPVVGETVH